MYDCFANVYDELTDNVGYSERAEFISTLFDSYGIDRKATVLDLACGTGSFTVELAKKGYYDGLTFHRVISDFMIQGGDPNGNGTGGESIWGGKFEGGTDPHLIHATGALAYANSGSTAANGSQFYVVTGRLFSNDDITYLRNNGFNITPQQEEIYKTVGGYPTLDGNYTVFGQVYSGLDVIFKIQNVATGANDKPQKDVIIDSVKVGEYDGEEIRWYYRDYSYNPCSSNSSKRYASYYC